MQARIVVADDSATMRMIVTTTLKSQGWDVVAASNGQDGLALARERRPDLVVTDWNMPVMGGLGFVQGLRADAATRHVPILVLTTEDDDESKQAARALGVNGWIYKPVDPALLVEVAASHLGEATGGHGETA